MNDGIRRYGSSAWMRPLRAGERGITLTELLVVLGVVAIIALVVVPAIAEWFRSYKIRSAAHQIQAELRMARSVAVAKNADVSLLIRRGELSWTDARGRPRQFRLPPGVSIASLIDPAGGDTVTFRNNGQPDVTKTLDVDGWVRGNEHLVWTVSLAGSGKVSAGSSIRIVAATPTEGEGGGGGGGGGGGERVRRLR